jgi:hypothetical protein
MAGDQKLRLVDKAALALEAVILPVILLFLTLRLGADRPGRVITVALLVVIFAALIHSLWRINLLRGLIRFSLALVVLAVGLFFVGWFVWPYTLVANPSDLTFNSEPPNQRMTNETFKAILTNRSDKDIYTAEIDFRLTSLRSASPQLFTIDIPTGSRKPTLDASNKMADTIGFLCMEDEKPVFALSINRLAPHESREFTISYAGRDIQTMAIKTAFYTWDPQPVSAVGNKDEGQSEQGARLSGSKEQCRLFVYMLDRVGMFWISKNGQY